MADRRAAAAETSEAQGDKLSKTTLFRWKPDWEGAAQHFDDAGDAYKGARHGKSAARSYLKAAHAFTELQLPHAAAVRTERAASMLSDTKMLGAGKKSVPLEQRERAATLYEEASQLFAEASNPDQAAESLVKASKALTDGGFDTDVSKETAARAVELVMQACESFQDEGREAFMNQVGGCVRGSIGSGSWFLENPPPSFLTLGFFPFFALIILLCSPVPPLRFSGSCLQSYRYALGLAVRHGHYDSAVTLLKRQVEAFERLTQNHEAHKAHLSILVILLKGDDYVAAEQHFQQACAECDGFAPSTEGRVGADLLDAVEKRDADELEAVLSKQQFGFLDNQVVRLAASLKGMYGGGGAKPKAGGAAAAASGEEEEDIDEDDLA
jgi:Soluble NSF attachment protein, SNAP